jgi:hypothetical protein
VAAALEVGVAELFGTPETTTSRRPGRHPTR